MEFIESLRYLEQSLQRYNQSESDRERVSRSMLLGTRFAEKVKGASTVEDLAALMIKGNQAAFAMGIPEFASQINNMGEIKRVEILSREGKIADKQKAQMLKGLYGDSMTLYKGEYIPMSETDEFKKVSEMDEKLQGDAYKFIYESMQTQTKGMAEYMGNNQFGYTEIAVRPGQPTKVIKRLLSKGGGKYDDIMTDAIESLDEPPEISAMKSTVKYEEDRDQRNFNQQLKGIDAQLNKQKEYYKWQFQFEKDKSEEVYKDPTKWETYDNKLLNNTRETGAAYFAALQNAVMQHAPKDKALNDLIGTMSNYTGDAKGRTIMTNPAIRDFIGELDQNDPLYKALVDTRHDFETTTTVRLFEGLKRQEYAKIKNVTTSSDSLVKEESTL